MMPRIDVVPAAGMDVQVGLLLAVLDVVTSEWRGELGDVPDGTVLWQPFPGGHSVGALLLHMADVEAHWLHEIAAGRERPADELAALLSEETDQYAVQWPQPPAQPLSWYYAQQDVIRSRTRLLLQAMSDPEQIRVHRGKEITLRWLLNHVVSHEAYHGGQAVLLSLMHRR